MARTPSTMLALGTKAPEFDLPDAISGERVSLASLAGRPLLVMFICNHCPFVKHVADELAAIGRDFGDRFGIVAIQSNDVEHYPDDAPDKMKLEAESRGYTFPYLHDADQAVAKAYRAACTPDFYVFDSDHRLAYRGQLDEARPGTEEPVNGADLRAAMAAIASGDAPAADQKPSIGCNIKWKQGSEPDYFLNPA